MIIFCAKSKVAQSNWQQSYYTWARPSIVQESLRWQKAEQQLGIAQNNGADYVHTKMQVSNCVMKSVLFPIFTIAKWMSRLAYTYIFSSTMSGLTSIFHVWLAKNDWHLNVFNILCNHNNSLEILKGTFGSLMNVCPLIRTQYCVSKTQTPQLGMSLSKIFLALNPISACYTLWKLEATVFKRQGETRAAWWQWSCESKGKH